MAGVWGVTLPIHEVTSNEWNTTRIFQMNATARTSNNLEKKKMAANDFAFKVCVHPRFA
jgi:hypothetical protein